MGFITGGEDATEFCLYKNQITFIPDFQIMFSLFSSSMNTQSSVYLNKIKNIVCELLRTIMFQDVSFILRHIYYETSKFG